MEILQNLNDGYYCALLLTVLYIVILAVLTFLSHKTCKKMRSMGHVISEQTKTIFSLVGMKNKLQSDYNHLKKDYNEKCDITDRLNSENKELKEKINSLLINPEQESLPLTVAEDEKTSITTPKEEVKEK